MTENVEQTEAVTENVEQTEAVTENVEQTEADEDFVSYWDFLPLELKEHVFKFVRLSWNNDPVCELLNVEIKQYHKIYTQWNSLMYRGPVFSKQAPCLCLECRWNQPIEFKCPTKRTIFYLKFTKRSGQENYYNIGNLLNTVRCDVEVSRYKQVSKYCV